MTLFILGLSDNIRGPMFSSILEQFQITQTTGSLFFSVASLFAWIVGSLSSILIHKYGAFKSLILSLGIMMLGCLMMGLIKTQFYVFLIGAVFLGASMGLMGVSQNVLVMVNAPAGKLAKYQSGLHAMYGISSLLAPFVVAGFVSLGQSYQNSFYVSALLCLVMILLSKFLHGKPGSTVEKDEDPRASDRLSAKDNFKFWKNLIIYSLVVACYVGLELSLSTRSSLFYEKELLFSKEQAIKSGSWFFMALALGRVLSFLFPLKWPVRIQAIVLLTLSVLFFSVSIWFKSFWIFFSGFLMAPLYPILMAYGAELFKKQLALMTSIAVSLSSMIVIIMHSMMGWVGDHFGVAHSFWVGIGFGILSLGLIFTLPKGGATTALPDRIEGQNV